MMNDVVPSGCFLIFGLGQMHYLEFLTSNSSVGAMD